MAYELSAEQRAALVKGIRAWNGKRQLLINRINRLEPAGYESVSSPLSVEGQIYPTLPSTRNLKSELPRINSQEDYMKVISELNLIREPDALHWSIDEGVLTTKVQKEVNSRLKHEIDMQRAQARANQDNIPLDSQQAYNALTDGTELKLPTEGEIDLSVEDISTIQKYEWTSEDRKEQIRRNTINNMVYDYLDMWEMPSNYHNTMQGYEQLIQDIIFLRDAFPDELRKVFNSGYDETMIDFIYITSEAYPNLTFEVRHQRAVNFWHSIRNEIWRNKLRGETE